MKRFATVGLCLLAFCTTSAFSQSQTGMTAWLGSSTDSGARAVSDGDRIQIDLTGGVAFGFGVTHPLGSMLEGEISILRIRDAASVRDDSGDRLDVGDIVMTPVVALVHYRLPARPRVRPFVGAGIAWVSTRSLESGDLDQARIGRIELDNDLTWALSGGVFFEITPRIQVGFDGKYIPVDVKAKAAGGFGQADVEIENVIVTAGLRWQF